MKWLVAVVAVVASASVQAKTLECIITNLRDDRIVLERMTIEIKNDTASVHHIKNADEPDRRREEQRTVLFHYNVDGYRSQTLIVLKLEPGGIEFAPELVGVDWSYGKIQVGSPDLEHFERRWKCVRLD